MLSSHDKNSITLCQLVEHPGGHDGGEFAQHHEFGVADDGSVYYGTAMPGNKAGVEEPFVDEDPEDFLLCATREGAVTALRTELACSLDIFSEMTKKNDS
jgi:hypothetical protein